MMTRILALLLTAAGTFVSLRAAEIFPHSTEWKYLKGYTEASSPDAAAWREIEFDDSEWEAGDAAFYYGDPFSGTVLNDMRNNYTSVYFRKTFTVEDPNAFSELVLEVLSDDGLIAWINGQEVGRFNMGAGQHDYDDTSLSALPEPIPYESYVIENPGALLVEGENVVAVHGFNSSIGSSSDFVFTARLTGEMDETAPLLEAVIPANLALVRTLPLIEVIFNEGVTGVDASDLLINGNPATSVEVFGANQYVFEFPEPPTGTVQVAWVEDHGIRDLSPLENPFAGGSWSYTFDPDAPLPGVIISEFMADNNDTLNDADGDASDWIELFNAGTESANLDGWFLTDTAGNLTQWRLPNVSIAPNSYLVVFASGKDRRNPADDLHTNFRLGADGEYLALVGPLTNVVSEFSPTYPAQSEDISYGRERSNPNVLGYFPTPTPGEPNTPGGAGFAEEVQFSVTSRTFRTPITLELSTSSPEAMIRYEIGTNMPSETSPIYDGPLTISSTAQVRARAYEPGLLPGKPRSEMYISIASPLVNVTSDLPIVVLHNYGGGTVSASSDKFVMMQVFEPKNGVASLTNAPDLVTRARFKRRGSSTEGLEKVSMAVEAWDEYGDDKDIPLLGMPEESDWVFYAPNFFEPVMLHNPFMYQLSRDIGQYASRTRFAEVYLNTGGGSLTSGNYWGIYVVEEKIKRDDNRVAIENLEPEHLEEPEVTGGYLLKIDRSDPGDSPFYAAGQSINYVDPKGEEIRSSGRDPQEQYIRNYFDDFGDALNSPNFADPVNGYAKYIDVPAAIDHHLLNVLAFNVDALRLSTYFHKDREGKIVFGPIWDFDRALGSTDGRDSNPFVWMSQSGDRGTDFFNYPWWGRMFRDLEFWQKYIDRYQELRRDEFSVTNLHRIIDEMADEVRQARPREYGRWSWGNSNYDVEVNHMKNWLANRIQFMDGQFLAAPTANVPFGMVSTGTWVTLTAPEGGTMYYTLDGTDPRAPGGNLAAGAQNYSGPIRVTENVRIFARARNLSHQNITGADNPPLTTPWSGATVGTYAVEVPQLAITEILYNPKPRNGSLAYADQDYEFVELMNVGDTALELGGAEFVDGIEFVFPEGTLEPGERILVVKNSAAFEAEYGTGHRVAGEFSGSLNNAGETLALNGRFGVPVVSFSYDPLWEPLTDGPGFSLVLRDEATEFADYGLREVWTHSAVDGGSPGSAEPVSGDKPVVLVNEIVSRPASPALDAVELHNPGAEPVDISGWHLTDDFGTPRKYRFPAGSTIEAGGYLVVTETEFNQGATGFAFGSEGEEVFLFSGSAEGDLTGYHHGFVFGPAFLDMSFGRHENSEGVDFLVRQNASSVGSANAGPAYGPVIISEILFYPPMNGAEDNNRDEFIELQNVTAAPVALFDAGYPTNTWVIRGGIDFTLPEAVTLSAGEVVLVVNFDPSTNATTTADFRELYDIDEAVRIFGPYGGQLSNNGEVVSLQEPDVRSGTDVEYVVVDEVTYSAAAPWPAGADATGDSLQRAAGSFANDPASWQVGNPTAGVGVDVSTDPDPDGDGLPTEWEVANGLDPNDATGDNGAEGDPDGDGISNRDEFVAGTDPQDAGSFLQLSIDTPATGSGHALVFEAAPGKSYSVYYRESLTEGSWLKLADIPAETAGGTVEVADEDGADTRFYRLVTPQQP